jgi:hypothetical protein
MHGSFYQRLLSAARFADRAAVYMNMGLSIRFMIDLSHYIAALGYIISAVRTASDMK